jgi:hypothetical protein
LKAAKTSEGTLFSFSLLASSTFLGFFIILIFPCFYYRCLGVGPRSGSKSRKVEISRVYS